MKSKLQLFSILLSFFIVLSSCNENKIDVSEGRFELPEPDQALRIDSEITESLSAIDNEISVSDGIKSCKSGEKLINSGIKILPYLKEHFRDSTDTKVYSKRNKRTLTIGEIAIITAGEIKPIPIAKVVGIQQCTPPIHSEIEYFLWKIKENPADFMKNYSAWIREE